MADQRWFYRTEEEWVALVERLKLLACPYFHRVGALIRHGSLFGFDDRSIRRRTRRARRIFCSNRYRRPGCGRTITAWFAENIL